MYDRRVEFSSKSLYIMKEWQVASLSPAKVEGLHDTNALHFLHVLQQMCVCVCMCGRIATSSVQSAASSRTQSLAKRVTGVAPPKARAEFFSAPAERSTQAPRGGSGVAKGLLDILL